MPVWIKSKYLIREANFHDPTELPICLELGEGVTATFTADERAERPDIHIEVEILHKEPKGIIAQIFEGLSENRIILEDPPQIELPYARMGTEIVDKRGISSQSIFRL